MRRLDKAASGGRNLQQSVALYIFLDVPGYDGLSDDGAPELFVKVLARTELFQLVVVMRHDVVGPPPLNKVYDIFLPEILLQGQDGL